MSVAKSYDARILLGDTKQISRVGRDIVSHVQFYNVPLNHNEASRPHILGIHIKNRRKYRFNIK